MTLLAKYITYVHQEIVKSPDGAMRKGKTTFGVSMGIFVDQQYTHQITLKMDEKDHFKLHSLLLSMNLPQHG